MIFGTSNQELIIKIDIHILPRKKVKKNLQDMSNENYISEMEIQLFNENLAEFNTFTQAQPIMKQKPTKQSNIQMKQMSYQTSRDLIAEEISWT